MIVTYFSATGTTESAAKAFARATGAELYRIEPTERYTRRDLDWNDASSRTSAERNDESARPSLAGKAPDLSAYDAVLVGFPIWWAVEPRIVDSFLDSVNLTGTTVAPSRQVGGAGSLARRSASGSFIPRPACSTVASLTAHRPGVALPSGSMGLGYSWLFVERRQSWSMQLLARPTSRYRACASAA